MKITPSESELGFDALPDGKYHVIFTDGDVRQTKDTSKHPENDYWNAEMTVQDGPLAGRKDWTNIMLPPYELYTLANILQAAGYTKEEITSGKVDVELFADDLKKPDDHFSFAVVGFECIVTVRTKIKNDQENRNHRFAAYDADEWEPVTDSELEFA